MSLLVAFIIDDMFFNRVMKCQKIDRALGRIISIKFNGYVL